ncbi:MAG: TatD family hydrolase [Chloroflexi bacterium]|nr:TatD family hydrolase [Chloroflexota bacterium]
MIDTHVHLDDHRFAADLPAIIERARVAGIQQLITIGTDLASSRRAIALSEQFSCVWATVGLHPHEAAQWHDGTQQKLEELAAHPRVVAIGETGLDFYRNLAPPDAQRRAFVGQLALARRLQLPVVVHCREAYGATVAEVEVSGVERVVMHCFVGERDIAERCVANGWFLAFGGAATYRRNAPLRDIIATLPYDRLLLETDAPYLPPEPFRGQRNEPAWIVHTAAQCAALRSVSLAELGEQSARNAAAAFPRLVV